MTAIDWSVASLTEAAQAIKSGATSSREVVEACLDRYRKDGAALGCFVELDESSALRQADEADRRRAQGAKIGPLHGVPLAHKDMFYREGRISACGSRAHSAFRAAYTATVFKRLDEAGALDIGRLAMVEFALGPHGNNPNYPQVRNPWNRDRIPGGSSSGSAVAVAARMVYGSLGTDTGGSIRGPAALCGVVGLKPTYGRVSRHGVFPLSASMDTVGPLTRTVRDAARILDVIHGSDVHDGSTFQTAKSNFEAGLDLDVPLPRIGIARGYFDEGLDAGVARAIESAADVFVNARFRVSDVPIPRDLFEDIADLQPLVLKVEGASVHWRLMQERESDYTTEVAQRLHAGFFISAADYATALSARSVYLRDVLAHVFSSVDILLTPTICMPAPAIADTTGKLGQAYIDMVATLTRNTKVFNYLGLPALSVPCGFSNELPTAFQLVAPPFREGDLLRAGHFYQQVTAR